jgi:hypothetical protein
MGTHCSVAIYNGGNKMAEDVQFETLKAEEVKFGKNNFLEVARKKAVTKEGENEFIAISRGFFSADGSKRFKKSITVPDDDKIKDFLSTKIKEL